jgi:hypothetical protein
MRKILLLAAVVSLAACGPKKSDTGGADTAGMAPATTPADTGMSMSHDTGMSKSDTTMARDTTKK